MRSLFDEHDILQAQLDALRKLVTILNYPESLAHEVRQGWPELQGLLRQAHRAFNHDLPRHFRNEEESLFPKLLPMLTPEERELVSGLAGEHRGLETLVRYLLELTTPWLSSTVPPPRSEIARLGNLVSELTLHLERHLRLENERVFPLAATLLSADDRKRIIAEIEERDRASHRRKAG